MRVRLRVRVREKEIRMRQTTLGAHKIMMNNLVVWANDRDRCLDVPEK